MSARLHPSTEELMERHGTTEQFSMAVWEAYTQLMISSEEAFFAIRAYNEELALAAHRA